MYKRQKKESIGYKFIKMLKNFHKTTKKGYIINFFIPRHRITIPYFDDCFENFADILTFIKNLFDCHNVMKEDRMLIWNELRDIYVDLKIFYDELEFYTEYQPIS